MKKVKKFVEPETIKGYGWENQDGNLLFVGEQMESGHHREIPARLIREKDYQRMKRICARAAKRKTP